MDQRAPLSPLRRGRGGLSSHRGIAALWKMYNRIGYAAQRVSTQLWINHLFLGAFDSSASSFKTLLSMFPRLWLAGRQRPHLPFTFYTFISLSVSSFLLWFSPSLGFMSSLFCLPSLCLPPQLTSLSPFRSSSYDSVNSGVITLPFQKSDCQASFRFEISSIFN